MKRLYFLCLTTVLVILPLISLLQTSTIAKAAPLDQQTQTSLSRLPNDKLTLENTSYLCDSSETPKDYLPEKVVITEDVSDSGFVDAQEARSTSVAVSPVCVNLPSNSDRYQFSEEEEYALLQTCVDIFNSSNRQDLIETWKEASFGEAVLEYNILFEKIQWIVPVYYNEACVGMIGLEPSGDLGWVNPSEGESLVESEERARNGLEEYVNASLPFELRLMMLGGSHYWFLNVTSSEVYIVDAFSGVATQTTMDELLTSAQQEILPPGAHGNTQIQPNTVPYFNQGSTSWCCLYSTTMVLAWWGYSPALNNPDQCASDLARIAQNQNPPDTNEGAFIGCAAVAVYQLTGFETVWHGEMKSIYSCDDNSPYDINDVKDMIYSGYIVVIEVDCDGDSDTDNDLHASVLIGYDDSSQTVYVNDPSGAWTWSGGDTFVTYANLESRWGAWDDAGSFIVGYGFWDKDDPSNPDYWPYIHKHKHLGMVIYPSWWWSHPHLNLQAGFSPVNPQTSIPDAQTIDLVVSLGCIYADAGSSGIHVRVSGGKIIGYSTSDFTAQRYDEQANPISVASPVIEFYRNWLTENEVYFATVHIKASDIGRMWVYTRGWATDTNDVVHCNYDSSKVNPWETRHHSTSVADDRPSPSIQMPSVEPWIIRQPESWADDRWDGSYKFTWYSCWENYFDVYDDDVTAPSFSYPSTYPSGVVYDSYTSGISSYILCYIDIHDLSGLSEVGFSYRFDTTAWSPWDVGSSDIGRVPRSVWINHIGERLYFKWYAIDNDFDRLNDWLRADSPEYTGPMIADDDTAGPSFSNPASSYIAATGAFRIQIDVTDPSGISMVRFWCTLDYSWHVPTGSSGNTYWYDIPYGTWSPYSGQTFNWYAGAGDSDNDRPWDRADSYSSVYDATLPLLPSYGVDIYINPSTALVAPGSSISYTVNVHNTGNIEDTYSLKLNGLDTTWYTFSTASVTVGAGQIVQVTLTISPPYASMILKDYPFIVIATSQGDPTASDSTNGIATVDFTPTLPTRPTGGLAIAVRPKTIYMTPGSQFVVNIYVINNQNFDDVLTIDITNSGIPTQYQANLAWFNWTNLKVFIPAGSNINIPLEITIPSETPNGMYIFKTIATSTANPAITAKDSGIIRLQ